MQDTAGEASDVLLHMGVPLYANQQQHCADRGCSLEDLPEVMDDRDG